MCSLRLLFVLAVEHTLLRMFLNIWRQILFPGCCSLNFCTTKCRNSNCPCGMQLPAHLSNCQCTFTQLQGVSNLIVSLGQFTLSVHYVKERGLNSEKHFVCFNFLSNVMTNNDCQELHLTIHFFQRTHT